MSTYILTSMFNDGFDVHTAEVFRQKISKRNKCAFVASEFEKIHEKTDKYFHFFLNMFENAGIHFGEAYVIDGRMRADEAQKRLAEADVVWLSGGDTPTQFRYFKEYGLDTVIKQHDGIIIGMSAGSINMAKTSICTLYQAYPSKNKNLKRRINNEDLRYFPRSFRLSGISRRPCA